MLNFIEAASLPYVHLTMWSALCDAGGLTEQNAKKQKVPIHNNTCVSASKRIHNQKTCFKALICF